MVCASRPSRASRLSMPVRRSRTGASAGCSPSRSTSSTRRIWVSVSTMSVHQAVEQRRLGGALGAELGQLGLGEAEQREWQLRVRGTHVLAELIAAVHGALLG